MRPSAAPPPFAAFAQRLAADLPALHGAPLSPGLRFRELPAWDSLSGLVLWAAMSELSAPREVSAKDVRRCATLGELYALAFPDLLEEAGSAARH